MRPGVGNRSMEPPQQRENAAMPQTIERQLAGEISMTNRRISRRWSCGRGSPGASVAAGDRPGPCAPGPSTEVAAPPDLMGSLSVLKPGETPVLKMGETTPDESDKVLFVLAKSFEMRSDEDLAILQRCTAEVKFFSHLTPQQHLELCRVMSHELVPNDTPVFTQGEEGTTFYIIYAGAAKVFITDGKLGEKPVCVCLLEDGDSFGELALIGNGIRNATVVTAMPTQLLKVEKDAYERSLQKLHETDVHARMRYLQRVFLFSDWADEDLKRLALVLSHRRYEKGTTIIRQGESTDNMYLLISGRCRVLKQMGLTRTQQQMLHSSRRDASGAPSPTPLTSAPDELGGVECPAVLEICELSAHQYFGELALLDKGEHTASVCATTPVEVFLLSKYDFYHHVDSKTQVMTATFTEE